MILKKIRLKNIRSYSEQEVIFPQGSTLISGDAGSGKTSLLLAVEYALFGLQAGQKGSSLLKNSQNSGEVSLEFESGGKNILVERGLKRTPKGVSNDYASITIDGQKFDSSVTEIKSKVVELLGYPAEYIKKNNLLYRYTVHSPQEQMKQIITEDPESRIDILRHIFGMNRYKQVKENLSVFLSSLKDKSKILQIETKDLESDRQFVEDYAKKISLLETKIFQKNKELEEKLLTISGAEKELSELREKVQEKINFERELDKTKIMFASKKEILNSLAKQLESLNNSIDISMNSFNNESYISLLKSIEKEKEESERLNSSYLSVLSKLNSLEKEKEEINLKTKSLFKIEICPTCLQLVSENHKHNIMNETESKNSQIRNSLESLTKERKILDEAIKKSKLSLKSLEEMKFTLEVAKSSLVQVEKDKLKIENLMREKILMERDLKMLENHVSSMKEKILQYSSFEHSFNRKEEQIKILSSQQKIIEISLAELKKEEQLSKFEISRLQKLIEIKESKKIKLRSVEDYIDWLSNSFLILVEAIERSLLFRLRSEFSLLFRKWFIMLLPDNSLESHIDDNFTPIIMQGENEMDYSFLSGGERTAVALAYRLALNQTLNSFMSKIKTKGLIILDEPTDGFSESQIEKMRDVLSELNASQIIIVSHEQKIEGFVDNVIRVSKESELSNVQSSFQESYQKT